VLSGGGDDYCRHYLHRLRHCHLGPARISFNLEVHYRRRLLRFRRSVRGDLCVQSGRDRTARQSILIWEQAMRLRPVRPNIYLPVVRFGVADSDWFSVLLISCAGYLAPVPFGITVFYVPLQMWTWLIATAGSIAFFNYIRIGKKPYWLQHKLTALFFHHK